ncbi:MAG: GxxExxY protein [Gammaproteobacteria bacterium]|nr:GxxExxY protein [Gammaproteobacteria bacterium]
MDVHKTPAPGLSESTCEQCLAHEFSLMGLGFQVEYPLPVEYKNVQLDEATVSILRMV